jgi:hypothetical protein
VQQHDPKQDRQDARPRDSRQRDNAAKNDEDDTQKVLEDQARPADHWMPITPEVTRADVTKIGGWQLDQQQGHHGDAANGHAQEAH